MKKNGVMECWNNGVKGSKIPALQYSNTPLLQWTRRTTTF